MASYATGISVLWNGIAFQEVVGLSWTYAGGQSRGRSIAWTDDAGTVSIDCLGANNTGLSNYGVRAQLQITGGGQALTNQAVWESLSVSSEPNDVTRYTVTLRLLDG